MRATSRTSRILDDPGSMIDVAVIARRRAPLLDAVLDALRDAGATGARVVYVGPDGPATARNAALVACTDEVLALVEDDVLVAPGWLAALEAAWRDAGHDVAVIGGPLAPVVGGPSPTYPGGNVSFRAAALRGAGGFWPARGRAGQRDWFSVEHEVQRELARMGWQSAFVPGMAARRASAPPGMRERARTGARRQAVGEPRSRGQALGALAKGLAGAAAGRRRERLG